MGHLTFFRISSFVFTFAIFVSSCKKQLPEDGTSLPSADDEITLSGTSAQNISYPDVTKEFDNILKETKKRCEQLKSKWPINAKTFDKDLNYLLSVNKDIEKYFAIYYGNFLSWQNLESRLNYIKGHFKDYAPGDIKTGVFEKYNNKNGGRVFYKGQVYSVAQLGNINFGVGCKAIGLAYLISACGAGYYQVMAEDNLDISTSKGKKLWSAIKAAVKDRKLQGVCLDHRDDSKMIKKGYNWF